MGMKKITCAITMGDAAGIGPEVVFKALADRTIQGLANFVLVGNGRIFNQTARLTKIRLKTDIVLLDIKGSSRNGSLSLEFIKQALRLIKAKKADVLVTAPVNKYTINKAGFRFTGHTEYLASATKSKEIAMMLVGGGLKIVLVTRHIALKDVPGALTKEKIENALALTSRCLKKYFGIARPRIAICGLNPHSGDQGLLGREEIKIIRPALLKVKHLGKILGPLPADTLFHLALQNKFDACLAMYHDQGLIPIKTAAFEKGVNLTLGLPFIRTSPDHGTAYDIAGKGCASAESMKEAIRLAVKIGLRIKK
jgi:4-hydroxythreonine-4-phosphate dehydrogenase